LSVGETTTGLRSVLSRPAVYELWSRLVGGHRGRSALIAEHVRQRSGDRVLDLGCGPGELVPYLGDVGYVGVDLSADYVARARERYGDRAEFRVGDATDIDADLTGFDVVVAFGVLHHLDDDGARRLLGGALRALRRAGRAVTVDPTIWPGQGAAARFVINRDRGEHVRSPRGYEVLASTAFADVVVSVRSDLLRLPYTHCVLECTGDRARA
jgi:SAM-dependent methyltransferase